MSRKPFALLLTAALLMAVVPLTHAQNNVRPRQDIPIQLVPDRAPFGAVDGWTFDTPAATGLLTCGSVPELFYAPAGVVDQNDNFTFIFNQNNVFDFVTAPAICSVIEVPDNVTTATAPDGTLYTPVHTDTQYLTAGVVDAVQLPIEAYSLPGNWTLAIEDAETTAITIIVPELTTPGILYGDGAILLTGFAANEPMVGLFYAATADGGHELVGDMTFTVQQDGIALLVEPEIDQTNGLPVYIFANANGDVVTVNFPVANVAGLNGETVTLDDFATEIAAGYFGPGGAPDPVVSGDDDDTDTADEPDDADTSTVTIRDGESCEHTVAVGQTLLDIARRYGVTVQQIADVNEDITNVNLIYPGSTLTIPDCLPEPLPPTVDTCDYTIAYGETLFRIAVNNRVTVSDMVRANPQITNTSLIFAGTVIQVPGCGDGLDE